MSARALCKQQVGQVEASVSAQFPGVDRPTSSACRGAGCRLAGRGNATVGSWDDADGGLRGLRARPGPDLLQGLRDHWRLSQLAVGVDLGGSSSLNLLVGDAERRYVVRVHRPSVTPERLGAIHQVRRVLLAGGVPCAPLVPTLQGALWISLQGRLVEVEGYADHDAVMDSWERLEVGMALLAQTHNLLCHVQVGEEGCRPRFANHLEPADVAACVRRGTERIRGWRPTAAERSLAAVAEELAELVTQAEAGLVSGLPRHLVHGDFWDNNVLFRHGCQCCWPTSTSWGNGPASMTWRSRCGAPAPTSHSRATRRRSVLG